MAYTLDEQYEEVLTKFTEWLNLWHADSDIPDETQVTRAMYDECDDPPRILSVDFHQGSLHKTKVVTIYANPYHDEGGPNVLTAFFDSWLERDDKWILADIIQDFDARRQYILNNGKFVNLPEGS